MTRPVIAISSGRSPAQTALGEVDALYLTCAYVDATIEAGGRPVVLPVTARLDPLLDGVDGLVLSGGGDIDPVLYGARPAVEVNRVDRERDQFELRLVQEAQDRAIPTLAVCRGMQLVNVAAGGTLQQHLRPSHAHWQLTAPDQDHHHLCVAGGRLERIVGPEPLPVNSFHHQGIDILGDGLIETARHDGAIEAIESANGLVVGVQWHPEHMVTCPRQLALFQDLIERARGSVGTSAGRSRHPAVVLAD